MTIRAQTSVFLLLILSASLWLRWPTLSEGKPFFYDEDEAHHFNRLANMVKNHTLNPEYFHKPSLHFYLRMPAVVLGYLADQSLDATPGLQNIRTRDQHGLARYAFYWSHPRVVMAARAVSLILTMLSVLMVYVVSRQLGLRDLPALGAAALFSASPELFHYSSFIGVDVPLLFFALLSTAAALHIRHSPGIAKLAVVGVLSGLAVSSKYNGVPIALLPLLLVIQAGTLRQRGHLITALLSPVAGFFIGSPYILLSFPLFYQQLSYEVWHYAIAGHEGHTAERGLPQVLHYGRWLMSDGIGSTATVLSLVGIIVLTRTSRRTAVLFLLFPILFFLLMCAQRANFVRNMVPILPFVAILSAVPLDWLARRFNERRTAAGVLTMALGALMLGLPLLHTWEQRREIRSFTDSRLSLEKWLNHIDPDHSQEIAISADLQPQRALRTRPDVSLVDPASPPAELYQRGYDLLVTRGIAPFPVMDPAIATVSETHTIAGSVSTARVLKNPAISVYRFIPLAPPLPDTVPLVELPLTSALGTAAEPHLWLSARLQRIRFQNLPSLQDENSLMLTVMSPWKDQQIELFGSNWEHRVLLNQKNPGEWGTIQVTFPGTALNERNELLIRLAIISSPAARELNQDTRRLGLAIREVTVTPAANPH